MDTGVLKRYVARLAQHGLLEKVYIIVGVAPLAFASGAGAEMRQALGVAVFFGMLGVTFFGLVFTPTFYVVFRAVSDRIPKPPRILKGATASEPAE